MPNPVKPAPGKMLGGVIVVLAIFVVVGVLTFAGPCVHEDGTRGGCYAASLAIAGLAIAAAGVAVFSMFSTTPQARGMQAIVAAALGMAMAIAPGTVVPLCMVQTMRCWTTMRPFAIALGAAIALIAIIQAVVSFRAAKR